VAEPRFGRTVAAGLRAAGVGVLLLAAASLALGGAPRPAGTGAAKAMTKPAAAQASAEQGGGEASAQAIERIFSCLAAGLPEDWQRAWVVLTEIAGGGRERSFEAKFYYSRHATGENPLALTPCDARTAGRAVYDLNEFLEPDKRQWKAATLVFLREGRFELRYDYEAQK